MSDKPKIGWIGVGLMGHGAAKNILEAGYPMMVKGNRNRVPVEDLCGRGATEAESPAAMARDCDVVFACVPSSEIVEAVVFRRRRHPLRRPRRPHVRRLHHL